MSTTQIIVAIASGMPWVRAALDQTPQVSLTAFEWAHISIAAVRNQTPLPTILQPHAHLPTIFIVVAGDRCIVIHKDESDWHTIVMRESSDQAKPARFEPQPTMVQAIIGALQQIEKWTPLPPPDMTTAQHKTMKGVDWTSDPGNPKPKDNPTPAWDKGVLAPSTYDFIQVQCLYNNNMSRVIHDSIAVRTPPVARVAFYATEALNKIFWQHWKTPMEFEADQALTDDHGNPLNAKILTHHVQSVRTVLYWGDRNRRVAKARQKHVLDTAYEAGLSHHNCQEGDPAKLIESLAIAAGNIQSSWPDRLHPQAQAALDLACDYAIKEFDDAIFRFKESFGRGVAYNPALAYLMAINLGAQPSRNIIC